MVDNQTLHKKSLPPITLLGGLCNPSDLQTTVPFALNTTVMVLCRRTSWADVKLFSMTAQMSLCWLTVKFLDDLDQLMHDQLWACSSW